MRGSECVRLLLVIATLGSSACSLRSFDGFSSEFDAGVLDPTDDATTKDTTIEPIDAPTPEETAAETPPPPDTSIDVPVTDTTPPLPDTFVPPVDMGPPEPEGPRLFVIAGSDGLTSAPILKSTVWSALINTDGTLGAWKAQNALPDPKGFEHQAAIVQSGVIYVLGGDQESAGVSNKMFRGDLSKTGGVTWTTIGNLDRPRKAHAAMIFNGYLYVLGGMTSATETTDTIVRTAISGTTSPSGWTTSALTMFEQARYHGVTAVSAHDSLFVFGGKRGTDVWENQIGRYLVSPSTGAVTSRFTQISAENLGSRAFHTVASYGGKMYVLGGNSSTAKALADVNHVTPQASDGILGTFKKITSMPAGRWGHASAIFKNKIYVVGGANGADTPTTDVFIGTFQVDGDIVWETKTEWKMPEARAFLTAVAY